jgi:hypothetical protein
MRVRLLATPASHQRTAVATCWDVRTNRAVEKSDASRDLLVVESEGRAGSTALRDSALEGD